MFMTFHQWSNTSMNQAVFLALRLRDSHRRGKGRDSSSAEAIGGVRSLRLQSQGLLEQLVALAALEAILRPTCGALRSVL